MFASLLKRVRETVPLVHNITNYVTVCDCANAVLAIGGSPIMADDVDEVCDITSGCNALVLNLGTLNQRTIPSMIAAGKYANRMGHPVVLDPVGAGASSLRRETLALLLREVHCSVIRGNSSEIRAVAQGSNTIRGVDADFRDAVTEETLKEALSFAKNLASKLDTVIALSGAIDIVCDSDRAYVIRNGHPMMARITGSGCMSSAVIGAFTGANPKQILDATACAVCTMGLCGERAAAQTNGTGTFRTLLMDELSTMNETILNGGIACEIR